MTPTTDDERIRLFLRACRQAPPEGSIRYERVAARALALARSLGDVSVEDATLEVLARGGSLRRRRPREPFALRAAGAAD